MPFGEPDTNWLLLGAEVQLRHAAYDLELAAEVIREGDDPEAREFRQALPSCDHLLTKICLRHSRMCISNEGDNGVLAGGWKTV